MGFAAHTRDAAVPLRVMVLRVAAEALAGADDAAADDGGVAAGAEADADARAEPDAARVGVVEGACGLLRVELHADEGFGGGVRV